ncbi:MAG: maleylpyruvate isomerase family mycothiol-dependent enzyme [Caldilineaceae bacterium]
MPTSPPKSTTNDAAQIPYPSADEAHRLLQVAFDRLIKLLENLKEGEWHLPTACTAWDVRQIVAHQAGGYASGTGYSEMFRQYLTPPRKGELPEDAVNRRQVGERADATPAQLIAELRQVGPTAMQKWAYQFRLVKPIAIPHPVGGRLSMRHLMWVIHSRDTWMHRLDICRATDRPFEQTAEHDGRIAALVMRDVAMQLQGKLGGRGLLFDLSGVAGGRFRVGEGEPAATLQMDILDFNIWASGRCSYNEAHSRFTLSGGVAWAESILKQLLILY